LFKSGHGSSFSVVKLAGGVMGKSGILFQVVERGGDIKVMFA